MGLLGVLFLFFLRVINEVRNDLPPTLLDPGLLGRLAWVFEPVRHTLVVVLVVDVEPLLATLKFVEFQNCPVLGCSQQPKIEVDGGLLSWPGDITNYLHTSSTTKIFQPRLLVLRVAGPELISDVFEHVILDPTVVCQVPVPWEGQLTLPVATMGPVNLGFTISVRLMTLGRR